MAIITISRQVAALGDEIAAATAEKLGYRFINRGEMEKRIIELGFPAESLKKYDERKPGLFASLVRGRDEYLNYLQTAVIEAACEGDCILIGRGAFVILENIPNLLSLRFVSRDSVRIERLRREFYWDEKKAQKRIIESDTNRRGFLKSFFNLNGPDPSLFHFVLNTGLLGIDSASDIIVSFLHSYITSEKEEAGKEELERLLKAQKLVNVLSFEYKLNINFLHASIHNKTVVLQGVADSSAVVENAIAISSKILPDYKIESVVTVVRDFKSYR